MTTTYDKFSLSDGSGEPPPNCFVFIEYLKSGRFGLFVRQPQWTPEMPVPNQAAYTVIGNRLYLCVCLGTPGDDGPFDAMANAFGTALEVDGIFFTDAALYAADAYDDEDMEEHLTDGERHWWAHNDGPYPGDDWYFRQSKNQG